MKKTIYFGGDISYKNLILGSLKKYDLVESIELNKNVDIIYWVYGGGPQLIKYIYYWLNPKKVIIIHWIGTDVLTWYQKIRQGKTKSKLYYGLWSFVNIMKSRMGKCINISGSEWLKNELSELRIESIVVPITSINSRTLEFIGNTPNKIYDFITYVPYNRIDFYGGDKVLKFARKMPSKKFLMIFPDLPSINEVKIDLPANIKVSAKIEFKEMQTLISQSKCFLRFTNHDGLSLSVLEALMHGIEVIWTHKFDYCKYVNFSYMRDDEIVKLMEDTVKDFTFRKDAHDFVTNTFKDEHIGVKMEEIFDKFYK